MVRIKNIDVLRSRLLKTEEKIKSIFNSGLIRINDFNTTVILTLEHSVSQIMMNAAAST